MPSTEHYIFIGEDSEGRPEFQHKNGKKIDEPFKIKSTDTLGFQSKLDKQKKFRIWFTDDTPLKKWKDKDWKGSHKVGDFQQIDPIPVKVKHGEKFFFRGAIDGTEIRDPDIQIDDTGPFEGLLVAAGIGFVAGALTGMFVSRRQAGRRQLPPPE